jgi:hypothetical protein
VYKSIIAPYDCLLFVGISVGEALHGACMSAKKTMEVGADLVALTLTESVALSTSGLKEVCALLRITYETISNSSFSPHSLKLLNDILIRGFIVRGLFESLSNSENLENSLIFKCA